MAAMADFTCCLLDIGPLCTGVAHSCASQGLRGNG